MYTLSIIFLIFLFFLEYSIGKIYIYTQTAWLTQKAYIKVYMECSGVYMIDAVVLNIQHRMMTE